MVPNVAKLKYEMGFLRHITTKIKRIKKDCLNDNPSSCNFVQVKPIPGRLLPSSACFRFSLTLQNYNKWALCIQK